MIEDVGNFLLVRLVDEIGRGLAGLAHPHVERPIGLKRKAAIGAIELHRRHADIHRHAIDRRRVERGQLVFHRRKRRFDQRQPPLAVAHQRFTLADRIGIAIEGEHRRPLGEHGARIAAGAERRIDVALAGQDSERIDHFIDQDGNVRRIGGRRVEGGHSVTPFSAMKKRAAAFCTSVALSQSISVFGSQISKKSSTPQKKACAPICA